MNSLKIQVIGLVQGVGYRQWTKDLADGLGLTGTVKNLSDGSVEVVAIGPEAILNEFSSRLREGPRFAEVESLLVDQEFVPGANIVNFSIIR